MRQIAAAYCRVSQAAALVGSQIEAKNCFAPTGKSPLVHMSSGQIAGDFNEVCQGKGNTIWRSHGSEVLRSRIEIVGDDNVVYLGGHSRLRGSDIRLSGNGCLFFFGALSTTGTLLCIAKAGASIVIGADCMFSTGIEIETSDHHGIYDATSGLRLNNEADVLIGNHVWVGRGTAITKGATVGSNTVVGQRSIVTGRLEEGCVYAGIPARKLREGIQWSRASAATLEDAQRSSVIRDVAERHRDYRQHLKSLKV